MISIRKTPAVLAFVAILALSVVVSLPTTPPALSSPLQQATPAPTPTLVPVGGKLQADNACYVRLQNLPPSPHGPPGRYGTFGGYNPDSGVLVSAGGMGKIGTHTSIYYDLYAIKLDSPAAQWQRILYSATDGYTRDQDKGCREMASVAVTNTLALSVLGKSGCDNGEIGGAGDVRGINIGDTADRNGVTFVPGMNAIAAPPILADNDLGLIQHFAVHDSTRNRLVFGQGTFSTVSAPDTRPEVYEGVNAGTRMRLDQLRPTGRVPERRYGSCGAYVRDKATGTDGVLVLGGTAGGPPGTVPSFNEVWWLDFSGSAQGHWEEITARFTNQNDMGYRWEGACAYDPETRYFYSWMGRANPAVPDGEKLSSGVWRVSLAQLVDATAPLTWERLAKDNMAGIPGRREIPNVWDARNKRMFVMGGRIGTSEDDVEQLIDVWAIYPGLTGDACANLDPYAPYAPGTPTPTPDRPATPTGPAIPTPTRSSGATAVPAPGAPQACPQLSGRVPAAVIAAAIANPASVSGWGQLQNPNLPYSPVNRYRTSLGLQNGSVPYHPIYNSVVFKAGCP